MLHTWSLVVLSGYLATAPAGPEPGPTAGKGEERTGAVPLRTRVVMLEGTNWRSDLFDTLELVDRKGATLVWTTDVNTAGRLFGMSVGDANLRSRPPADVLDPGLHPVHHVAWLDRKANGPRTQASSVAFVPVNEALKDDTEGNVSGRRDGEKGVIATVAIRDSRFITLHTANVHETMRTKSGSNTVYTSVNATFQVPEVVTTEVEGSWSIAPGRVLLIGLGTHSAPEARTGRWIPGERVVVIDANDLDEAAFTRSRRSMPPPRRFAAPASGVATLTVWAVVVVLGAVSLVLIAWSLRRGQATD